MGTLDGRVAIVTGAGRGIGRSTALLLAREGASVVVNDLGAAVDGSGGDNTPAQEVVTEITSTGGKAIASGADVSDHAAAEDLIKSAIAEFGRLDVLVNVAGILRDRMIFNMSEQEPVARSCQPVPLCACPLLVVEQRQVCRTEVLNQAEMDLALRGNRARGHLARRGLIHERLKPAFRLAGDM